MKIAFSRQGSLYRNVHEITLTFVASELALLKHASALNVKVISCTFLSRILSDVDVLVRHAVYQFPRFGMEVQGSLGARLSPR